LRGEVRANQIPKNKEKYLKKEQELKIKGGMLKKKDGLRKRK